MSHSIRINKMFAVTNYLYNVQCRQRFIYEYEKIHKFNARRLYIINSMNNLHCGYRLCAV